MKISRLRRHFLPKSFLQNSIWALDHLACDTCSYCLRTRSAIQSCEDGQEEHLRGHSYVPADRAFGRVEKKMRKVEEVLDPAGYHKIYKEIAGVRVLGTDWDVKNYKGLTTILKKIECIREMKRIFLQKSNTTKGAEIKIKLELTYRYDHISKEFYSMTKRGHSLRRDLRVWEEKKENVLALLDARFVRDWEELIPLFTWVFYNDVFTQCDCLEEETELRHI
nr:unnamed protein product [Callosobruchus analis]